MNKIKLISDSSCDFSADDIRLFDADIVPFSVSFDDTTYLRENIDITLDEFYEKLKDPNVFAKTSLPSVNLYIEAFEKAIKEGKDILCFTISSKFSGSYQSAVNAKQIILEDHPTAKIEIVDSLSVVAGQGALIKFANKLIENGKTLDEVYATVVENRSNICLYLTVNTLKYLQKGGRIGKASALAGELLNISPILSLEDGELQSVSKVRGQKKANATLSKLALDFLNEKNKTFDTCEVFALNCVEDIAPLTSKLEEDGFKNIQHRNIGITITAHTGISITAVCVTCFNE